MWFHIRGWSSEPPHHALGAPTQFGGTPHPHKKKMKNFDTQCLIYEIDQVHIEATPKLQHQNSKPKLESLCIFQNSTKEKWNSSNPNQTKKTQVSEKPNRNSIPIFYNLQQQTMPTIIPQKLTHTQRHKPKKKKKSQ